MSENLYIYPVNSIDDNRLEKLNNLIKIEFIGVWFYPENMPIDSRLIETISDIEPITIYDDINEYKAFMVKNKDLKSFYDNFKSQIDSIGFYIDKQWKYCFIPHEKIVIIKTDLTEKLINNKIEFQSKSPNWW